MATDDFMIDDLEIGFGGGPPAGAYKAEFLGVKRTEQPDFGPGLRFEFRVIDGGHAGSVAAITTGAKPTPANKAGRVIAQILGAAVAGGNKANLSGAVGKAYLIVCEATPSGKGTKVSSIVAQ
jgi:hypothetical protein